MLTLTKGPQKSSILIFLKIHYNIKIPIVSLNLGLEEEIQIHECRNNRILQLGECQTFFRKEKLPTHELRNNR